MERGQGGQRSGGCSSGSTGKKRLGGRGKGRVSGDFWTNDLAGIKRKKCPEGEETNGAGKSTRS